MPHGRADSPIKTAKDLRGKTVLISSFKQISELGLDIWLDKNGVKPDEVKVTEMVMSQMSAAILRGTADAAHIGTPMFQAGIKTKQIRVLADTLFAIAPRYLSGSWFSTREFATKNPEAMKRFASAIHDAGKWATAHWSEALPSIAKYTKTNIEDLGDVPPAVRQRAPAKRGHALIEAAAKYGYLPRVVAYRELRRLAGLALHQRRLARALGLGEVVGFDCVRVVEFPAMGEDAVDIDAVLGDEARAIHLSGDRERPVTEDVHLAKHEIRHDVDGERAVTGDQTHALPQMRVERTAVVAPEPLLTFRGPCRRRAHR